jgi:methylthioribose-1-phosphate isomerase
VVAADDEALRTPAGLLDRPGPTAVNLAWAVQRMRRRCCRCRWRSVPPRLAEADAMADEDVAGQRRHRPPWPGPAAAPSRRAPPAGERADALQRRLAGHGRLGHRAGAVYQAQEAGLPVHVWVDETRPRNQGASLTAWELGAAGVPHTVIADNAGGHLMQRGQVDLVIVGCDRVSARGDVCNKIGTYLKALAAHDNGVPFYAAMPCPRWTWRLHDGLAEIPIEAAQRARGDPPQRPRRPWPLVEVQLVPDGTPALNPAFDVTPARLVNGLITERGVVAAEEAALRA